MISGLSDYLVSIIIEINKLINSVITIKTDLNVFLHILHYRFQVSCSYNIFHFNITACFLICSPQNGHITSSKAS